MRSLLIFTYLAFQSSLIAMEKKETHTLSHETLYRYSQKGLRSPSMSKTISSLKPLNVAAATPANTPEPSMSFSAYEKTGETVVIPIESADNVDQEVKKECTKLKLVILAGASALVSSGVTAAITYFNSKC